MLRTAYYKSPIGLLEIKGSFIGINSIRIVDNETDTQQTSVRILSQCIEQLDEYFARKRNVFDLKLDWSGSTFFNKTVWRALMEIPYGHTVSYSSIAKKIGKPKAVRAVGMANRLNPIPIIVPCHRVVGKGGSLTGYYYGLGVKRQLLELENPLSYAEQGTLF